MKHANFLKHTKHVIWSSMPSTRAARQAREHAKHLKLAEHASTPFSRLSVNVRKRAKIQDV